jgi:hypothetical protein
MAKDISAGDTLLRPRVYRFTGFRHGFDLHTVLRYGDRKLEPES